MPARPPRPRPLPQATLRKDLADRIRGGHPWVYADALSLPPALRAGQAVDLFDQRGRFLARGLADPASPIALRIWTLDPEEAIDAALLAARLKSAWALRRACVDLDRSDAYRLLHGEGDRAPGLVCDRYGDTAVVQLDGPSAEPLLPALAEALPRLVPGIRCLLRRRRGGGSGGAAALEAIVGTVPDGPWTVRENGLRFEVDVARGQKTGLYLDQRENRRRVGALAAGRRVLNLHAYTGGFSVAAALGGAASVLMVDLSVPALEAARRNFRLNGLDPEAPGWRFVAAEAGQFLAECRDSFDLVVLDPPSMAPSQAARPRALAAYRHLNALALARLAPRGWLFSASCSSHVTAADLVEALGEGARRAGRALRIVERLGAGPDHPTLPAFPEGDYLHALLAFVD